MNRRAEQYLVGGRGHVCVCVWGGVDRSLQTDWVGSVCWGGGGENKGGGVHVVL